MWRGRDPWEIIACSPSVNRWDLFLSLWFYTALAAGWPHSGLLFYLSHPYPSTRSIPAAGDDEIGRNLTVLAKTRPDIFGSTQEELQTLVGKHIEEQRVKEAAGAVAA